MLENSKCILIYGFKDEELEMLKMIKLKLIKVTPEMTSMRVKDIVDGIRIFTYKENMTEEKLVLFNNCESQELYVLIKFIKKMMPKVILATVTPLTNEWTFEYLLSHLIKEKEWIESRQEGR
ncbi:DUF3783 domain-containing protein [Clostridium sp. SHJSY1]|uniref:DUF3783 domain-containing protein n=1 Tax=Clostridium sp. SHJSY1 TaxID=2942483 RepID=UPI002875A369|nr:DUF3783 domain-containing protein [Clostridium sp. SHJSY1]MDS0525367.1 DUF3783 domain-containing protein [Clostridium sp. SHJSY1]